MAAPGQRAEPGLALLQPGPRPGARPLQAHPHVRGQGQRHVAALGGDDGLVVALAGVLPAAPLAAVVEGGLAVHAELDRAVHAPHGAQQHVLGVVVGRRPPVRAAVPVVVPPRPHDQAVAHHHPALAAVPAGLQDHGAGQVAPVGRDHQVLGAEPEPPGVPVQQGAENARAVHPRQAHPLDRAARRDQRGDLAVRQEAVIGDRRVRREVVILRAERGTAGQAGPSYPSPRPRPGRLLSGPSSPAQGRPPAPQGALPAPWPVRPGPAAPRPAPAASPAGVAVHRHATVSRPRCPPAAQPPPSLSPARPARAWPACPTDQFPPGDPGMTDRAAGFPRGGTEGTLGTGRGSTPGQAGWAVPV